MPEFILLKMVRNSDMEIGFRSRLETGRNTGSNLNLYITTLSPEAAQGLGHAGQEQG